MIGSLRVPLETAPPLSQHGGAQRRSGCGWDRAVGSKVGSRIVPGRDDMHRVSEQNRRSYPRLKSFELRTCSRQCCLHSAAQGCLCAACVRRLHLTTLAHVATLVTAACSATRPYWLATRTETVQALQISNTWCLAACRVVLSSGGCSCACLDRFLFA